MNNTLARLTQPDNGSNNQSNGSDKTNSSVLLQQQSSTRTANSCSTDIAKHITQDTGNYPSTPVLNNLIMATSRVILQPQSLVATSESNKSTQPLMSVAAVLVFKSAIRKYLFLDYTKLKGICDVQGFSNPYAARSETEDRKTEKSIQQ
ncbi:6902_t:CDS:2 [Cetraspora pellucida]|uniref:6902_t:CDS:1 n=1 Tax=Cetraspora pellucida TaxID=1433469 RepID=A0ACA9L5A3_9GLOM|nr:6902_t:CDS:2 [Cetraspora pellucida]